MNDTELAEIVCARICHDLVSPVGAVVNGTDLMTELDIGTGTEEMALVTQSAKRAADLLKFHRLAFGPVSDTASSIKRAQLIECASDVLTGPRVALDWAAGRGPAVPATTARMTCLMLLAGRAMLGMNGKLRVVLPADGGLPVAVIAEGAKAGASDEQQRWLAKQPGPEPDSRQVEFALLGPAADAANARIELVKGTGQVALRAVEI